MATYNGTCGTSVNWTFDTDTGVLTISGTGAMDNYSSTNYPWANHRGKITSLYIESGVTSIGERTCVSCSALTSIVISDSVTSIGMYAFQNCTALTSITFLSDTAPILDRYSFRLSTSSSSPVAATIYSSGWASDSVFKSTVRGSYTTFTYKPLPSGGVKIPVNVNGSWVDAVPYVNVNGTWLEVTVYVNVNGTWKETV